MKINTLNNNDINILSQMASSGDERSAFFLGIYYLHGTEHIIPYPEEAKYWLKKAYAHNPQWFNQETKQFVFNG